MTLLPVPPHPPRILPASLAEPQLEPSCGLAPLHPSLAPRLRQPRGCEVGVPSRKKSDVRQLFASLLKGFASGLHNTRCRLQCLPVSGLALEFCSLT